MPSDAAFDSSSVQVTELCSANQQSCGAFANLVIKYYRSEPELQFLHNAERAIVQYARRYAEGVGMLILIDARAPTPNDEIRAAIRQSYVDLKGVVRGAVEVVEGHGFGAAAKRSAITLINATGPLPFSLKVAGSIAEATPMLLAMLPASRDTLHADAIGAAVERVRANALSA